MKVEVRGISATVGNVLIDYNQYSQKRDNARRLAKSAEAYATEKGLLPLWELLWKCREGKRGYAYFGTSEQLAKLCELFNEVVLLNDQRDMCLAMLKSDMANLRDEERQVARQALDLLFNYDIERTN